MLAPCWGLMDDEKRAHRNTPNNRRVQFTTTTRMRKRTFLMLCPPPVPFLESRKRNQRDSQPRTVSLSSRASDHDSYGKSRRTMMATTGTVTGNNSRSQNNTDNSSSLASLQGSTTTSTADHVEHNNNENLNHNDHPTNNTQELTTSMTTTTTTTAAKSNTTTTTMTTTLSCSFRSKSIPVYVPSHISIDLAQRALESEIFRTWLHRCETTTTTMGCCSQQDPQRQEEEEGVVIVGLGNTTTSINSSSSTPTKCLDLHSLELQSIDMFGPRRVGFIKLKSNISIKVNTTTTTTTNTESEIASKNSTMETVASSSTSTSSSSSLSSTSKDHITNDEHHRTQPQQQTSLSTSSHLLPGICFLRGNAVSILVVVQCVETNQRYILMVEQPRVPVGLVSSLELPAGMIDSISDGVQGTAIRELEEECGIVIVPSELIDLTHYLSHETTTTSAWSNPSYLANTQQGIAPSPGGCDEHVRLLYLHRFVTRQELDTMQGRLTGLRDEGELITLHAIPYEEAWKVSGDMKVMCSLFLLERLQAQGKITIPSNGEQQLLQQQEQQQQNEPTLTMNNGLVIPRMAFGLYLVPPDEEGEKIILHAIEAGYRHFDTASYYGNEGILGRAIAKSGIPRNQFFLCSKVWNDSQKKGRQSVRESVCSSLEVLRGGGGHATEEEEDPYWDLFLVHWPVPDHFIETYKELEELNKEGKIKSIGISNFSPMEFEQLLESGISVLPAIHQMEVSPVMYRRPTVEYFQHHPEANHMLISAFKALNRGKALEQIAVLQLAEAYKVSPAQILLRWAIQKGWIVVTKTAHPERMRENRHIWHFSLQPDEMNILDALTTEADIKQREQLEEERKRCI